MDTIRNNDNRLVCIKRRRITMSELKCPFCGEKLVKWIGYADCRFWTCYNVLCEAGRFGHIADECIWQELIRTRKALDVAVDALNAVTATPLNSRVIHDVANKALEQITALEQKK